MSTIGYFLAKLKKAARKESRRKQLLQSIRSAEMKIKLSKGDKRKKRRLLKKAKELKHLCP